MGSSLMKTMMKRKEDNNKICILVNSKCDFRLDFGRPVTAGSDIPEPTAVLKGGIR